MPSPENRLDQYLHEALALERTLVGTLGAHLLQTPAGPYRDLIERHLHETRSHAVNLSSRLDTSTSLPHAVLGLAHTALGGAFNLAKAPLDLIRGGGAPDLVKNARDACASEALEIALHDAIDALAPDEDTKQLAREHRADEERMLKDLRALIPTLATGPRRAPAPPIEGYDDLDSGQVVARLGDLSQADLAQVLAYERAHRNRRAIIERGDELTGTPPWPGCDGEDTEAVVQRGPAPTPPAVRDYESKHRRRVAVLEAAQQVLTSP